MKVEPKTAKEVDEASLYPAGVYDFEVTDAVEDTSKSGNDMISLTLHVYNTKGAHRTVFDWLVATDGGAYKVRHFAEATGLLAKYEAGTIDAAECEGRTGKCKLALKPAADGYPAKNAVADYVKASGTTVEARKPAVVDDSDIPF